MNPTKHYALPKSEERSLTEAQEFAVMAKRFESGEISANDFAPFRLMRGVYGIRGAVDHHMVRVKIPGGLLDADQMERLATVAEQYTDATKLGGGLGHITTRQSVQFHWVHRRQVSEVLRLLAEVGLTSREACSNTVRNVTACHLAGVCATEEFDTWAYAKAMQLHFLRNGISQNLPRKFKFSFSGCATDCAYSAIHDVGVISVPHEVDGRIHKGFRIVIGGGLGPVPRPAILLEDWTPADLLLVTAEAVVRVFDRHGNRKNRNAARLKFVIEKLGEDEVRQLVFTERESLLRLDPSRRHDPVGDATSDASSTGAVQHFDAPEPDDHEYRVWRNSNVVAQQQAGYNAIFVALTAGDLTPAQFRGLAAIARKYGNGSLSTSQTQNAVLRWVPTGALPLVWQELKAVGMGRPGALWVTNVIGCPGAQTCNIAVTHSHQLAYQVVDTLLEDPELALDPSLSDVRIKISGCPNSCGQHHIADIGMYGNSRKKDGHSVPSYLMLLGGHADNGVAEFGRPFMRTGAKAAPGLVVELLKTYRQQRLEGESFRAWIHRLRNPGEATGD